MGITVVEQQSQLQSQSQSQSQSGGGDIDTKKSKRRSSRRSVKPSFSPNNGSALSEITDQHYPRPQMLQNIYLSSGSSSKPYSPNKVFNVGVNSLPRTHIGQQGATAKPDFNILPKSCPIPNEESVGQDELDLVPAFGKRKCFEAHWSFDTVKKAMQSGEVFQAQIRVNAYNKAEAYCTIEGIPTDILINGIPRQNRAIEGDIVAVKVDAPQLWSKMKGSGVCGNGSPSEDQDICVTIDATYDRPKGKNTADLEGSSMPSTNCPLVYENGFHEVNSNSSDNISILVNGHNYSSTNAAAESCYPGSNDVLDPVERLRQFVVSMPCKRPTGTVVAIIEPSSRRHTVVGFLNAKWWLNNNEGFLKHNRNGINLPPPSRCDYIHLVPSDAKLPKMIIPVKSLPSVIKKRLDDGDASVETELVSARIDDWSDGSLLPQACVVRCFGRGGEVEPRIEAILFEYGINSVDFSPESLSCLPDDTWQVPQAELVSRRDIRNLCVFTIDPSTATDLDDALSVERMSNGIYRVGVHIADVSYFVQPDTALDTEAQARSTSVYMQKRKISMLPSLLSENLGSLIPGVDRLTFSIFWDIDISGNIFDRFVSRTVIRSCCKLSYEHAQQMIEGQFSPDRLNTSVSAFPQLYGSFGWHDIHESVKTLHELSKALKEHRFSSGALRLDNARISFLLDEFGNPYDCTLCERKDSNFLVEEFMLLANRTAGEIISKAFPENALLRRHPKPNMRKLNEFEVFCRKHGFALDASSSGSLNRSLEKIREKLKDDDSVFYDILINYATKPMQLAKYFCSGDITVGKDDWGHYALAVPLYTHFTSPLRRYPDILVHRALAAAIEAEQEHLKHQRKLNNINLAGYGRCFTGVNFNDVRSPSVETLKALSDAAVKHKLPCTEELSTISFYFNTMKLASRQVKDAIDRLYMWVLLKNKEIFLSEARVLGVGPRFMSIYIQRLAIERRIYYDEVDGLIAEWLDSTSTLVLHYAHHRRFQRGANMGRYKPLEEAAFMDSPYKAEPESDVVQIGNSGKSTQQSVCSITSPNGIDPAVFPLTIRVLSTIPVALHAIGGDDGPLDIAARLYVASYFS